jgi:hypothetical protein
MSAQLIWEFLEEYRCEQAEAQPLLLQKEPTPVGDERWDVLLAALAEHLAARLDLAPPPWAESRVLRRAWFPGGTADSAGCGAGLGAGGLSLTCPGARGSAPSRRTAPAGPEVAASV